ncbi:hypothetical protein PG996_011070 [Apiospora saccharicola]|uniref:Uncharacterized protein n=1 Tax=Apiospora saccharicola TaxID=335842 RepID=A0ABR1UE01_9PEZI
MAPAHRALVALLSAASAGGLYDSGTRPQLSPSHLGTSDLTDDPILTDSGQGADFKISEDGPAFYSIEVEPRVAVWLHSLEVYLWSRSIPPLRIISLHTYAVPSATVV